MTLDVGDRVLPDHYDRLIDAACDEPGLRFDVTDEPAVDALRDALLTETAPDSRRGALRGRAVTFNNDRLPDVLACGQLLAWQRGLASPWHGLVHRDTTLAYHRDTQHPYPCTNLTVLLARDIVGGALVLPERRVAVACVDRGVVVFDGQELHGVAPFQYRRLDSYRLAVTFYCPRTAS